MALLRKFLNHHETMTYLPHPGLAHRIVTDILIADIESVWLVKEFSKGMKVFLRCGGIERSARLVRTTTEIFIP